MTRDEINSAIWRCRAQIDELENRIADSRRDIEEIQSLISSFNSLGTKVDTAASQSGFRLDKIASRINPVFLSLPKTILKGTEYARAKEGLGESIKAARGACEQKEESIKTMRSEIDNLKYRIHQYYIQLNQMSAEESV